MSDLQNLYTGGAIDIWFEDDEEDGDIFTIAMFGRLTVNLSREEFQELCNATFLSKTVLNDMEKDK